MIVATAFVSGKGLTRTWSVWREPGREPESISEDSEAQPLSELIGFFRVAIPGRGEVVVAQIEAIEQAIETVDVEVGSHLDPFRGATTRLMTMPGITDVTRQVIVSEIGSDMSRFPTAGHLVSWAGLCPGRECRQASLNTGQARAPWLKATLVQAAWPAVRTKNSYLQAQFFRLKSRRGPKKAIVALIASMLRSAYHMLRNDADYRDLSPAHFDAIDNKRSVGLLVRRLKSLGYEVGLTAA